MRIALVNTQVPFVRGGAEILAEGLLAALSARGHEVELVRLPFRWYPPEKVLDHMLAARLLRVSNVDRVIGLKFPAYLTPHDDKVLWILHPHRQAYDFWGTEYQDIPDTAQGRALRAAILRADRREIPSARRAFTISQTNAQRMRTTNEIECDVLYPPLPDDVHYLEGPPGDYLFLPSRIVSNKRQSLAVRAMAHVRSDVRLVIAGAPDRPEYHAELLDLIEAEGVGRRVEVIAGWIEEQRKLELLAGALGVLYPPFDEDFGYVTLEAFSSAKPVITCSDSGGPLEFVQDGVNGYVCEPEPQALARAIDALAARSDHGVPLGRAGRDLLLALDISWEHVVRELTR
jgi:glycosyltransferase involved in cell wall biosynthesis